MLPGAQVRDAGAAAGAGLPERIAWAVLEFCGGPLAENLHRVGKPLITELTGLYSARRGGYRVSYAIYDDRVVVEVAKGQRRSTAYRSR